MSHCGPPTTYFLGSSTLLRICTPLLAFLPVSFTWKCSSKSLYLFLLHRNVLNFPPPIFSVEPTMAPSFTLQYSGKPSQPARSLPLKNEGVPSPARAPTSSSGMHRTANQKTDRM